MWFSWHLRSLFEEISVPGVQCSMDRVWFPCPLVVCVCVCARHSIVFSSFPWVSFRTVLKYLRYSCFFELKSSDQQWYRLSDRRLEWWGVRVGARGRGGGGRLLCSRRGARHAPLESDWLVATNQQYLHKLCDEICVKSIVIKEIDVTLRLHTIEWVHVVTNWMGQSGVELILTKCWVQVIKAFCARLLFVNVCL